MLRDGGCFVAKIFRGRDVSLLYSQLRLFFTRVTVAKPKSSRNSSIEAFVVCQGFAPPGGYDAPAVLTSWLDEKYGAGNEMLGPNNLVLPSHTHARNMPARIGWTRVEILCAHVHDQPVCTLTS